jgi:hypothetical protein
MIATEETDDRYRGWGHSDRFVCEHDGQIVACVGSVRISSKLSSMPDLGRLGYSVLVNPSHRNNIVDDGLRVITDIQRNAVKADTCTDGDGDLLYGVS